MSGPERPPVTCGAQGPIAATGPVLDPLQGFRDPCIPWTTADPGLSFASVSSVNVVLGGSDGSGKIIV